MVEYIPGGKKESIVSQRVGPLGVGFRVFLARSGSGSWVLFGGEVAIRPGWHTLQGAYRTRPFY